MDRRYRKTRSRYQAGLGCHRYLPASQPKKNDARRDQGCEIGGDNPLHGRFYE